MLIPNDPDAPTQLECHSFEQEGHSTRFHSEYSLSVHAPTETAKIRGRYPVDGDDFPIDMHSVERAQITARWWIDAYIERCLIDLCAKIKRVLKREPTREDHIALINAIFERRTAGELPYDMNMIVFLEIKGGIHS